MPRYIDADNILYKDLSEGRGVCWVTFRDWIKEMPTADVRENVRGEWFPDMIYDGEDEWCFVECSNCKYRADKHYNFCPNCGADMRPISALSENVEIVSNLKRGEL